MYTDPSRLKARVTLDNGVGPLLGETRVRLLEAIDQYGSIAQAAKRVPLSYKSAWDAVDDMNNLAERPLVDRTVGGSQGGGSRLTDDGRRLVQLYRAVAQASQAAADGLAVPQLGAEAGLLRRLLVRTSARNQFYCTVRSVERGVVNAQVVLELDDAQTLVAQVTVAAVEQLELAFGVPVVALVMASSVLVMVGWSGLSSASNHLRGRVSRVHDGPVSAEVVVQLEGAAGRHVTTIMTTDARRALELEMGSPVTLAVPAASIVLAVV